MHLLDLTKQAVNLYQSERPLHIKGPPGLGKTDIMRNEIRQVLSEHFKEEFGFHEVVVPTYESPDFRGFLIPTKDSDGHPTSFFTRSAVLPSRDYIAKHKRGIMFLDERDQADQITQKALAPAVHKKQFGDERLPDGWWIVSASNRMADGAGVAKPLKHLINRERILDITPHVYAWAVWAENRALHPMLIAFAKTRPGLVFSETVPKEDAPFCTPRSYTATADLLALIAGTDPHGNPVMKIPNNGMSINLVAGDIGGATAAELFAFLKTADDLPSIEEVLENPAECKCPKDLSAAYAALQMLIHYAKPQTIDKLWTFAERFPKELQVSACTSLSAKGGGVLLNSTALNKWIMANRALINASVAR